MKEYHTIVYIGRFQPFHLGHFETLKTAFSLAERVILIVGSHNAPRTVKNPWTAAEREAMLRSCYSKEDNDRLCVVPVEDRLYSDVQWVRTVESNVRYIVKGGETMHEYLHPGVPYKPRIGLIGFAKDLATSKYTNQFKQWERVPVTRFDVGDDSPLNATKIRELLLTGHVHFTNGAVPPTVFTFLKTFSVTDTFKELLAEYEHGIGEERLYDSMPKGRAINHLTADAVVIQSGCVLLIQRKHSPGKGLWALPGGHVNANERIEDACIRELIEETGIKVPEKVLRGSIFCEHVFDHPDRSLRGRITRKNARTVTMAFGIKLDDAAERPRVVASDDAHKAWWFTFDEIAHMRDQIFEDHASLIEYMLSRVPQ
jgi:bifunctional NMN adenylyltransferase/nudix hydrolase